MEDKQVLVRDQKTTAELHRDKQVFENKLASMPERDRRKVIRRMDAGENVDDFVMNFTLLGGDDDGPAEMDEGEIDEEAAMMAAMEAMDEEDDFAEVDDDAEADEV